MNNENMYFVNKPDAVAMVTSLNGCNICVAAFVFRRLISG